MLYKRDAIGWGKVYFMLLQLWLENLQYLQLVCMYNAIQQISGLVIILTVYYLATSITVALGSLSWMKIVVLFAVQRQRKHTSYSKNLAVKREDGWGLTGWRRKEQWSLASWTGILMHLWPAGDKFQTGFFPFQEHYSSKVLAAWSRRFIGRNSNCKGNRKGIVGGVWKFSQLGWAVREREKGDMLVDLTGGKLVSLAEHTYLPRGWLIYWKKKLIKCGASALKMKASNWNLTHRRNWNWRQ